jgi:outer membrane protein assembly factor BamB
LNYCLAAEPIPVTNESRYFTHPAPASDTFFGGAVDISNGYIGVLGRRGTTSVATQYDAFIFDAVTGQHIRTFSQPVPANDVNYRFESIAIDGNLAVIGATGHVPLPGGGTAFNAGFAYVYDLTTGQLKHTLISTTPQDNFLFGTSVDILGNRIAVGSWGNAYVFDATTGAQLAKLHPSTPSDQFGISVALSGEAILVGSNSDNSRGNFTGATFTFDSQSFAQITKFVPPSVVASDNFGINVALDGRYGIAGGKSGAFVFDALNGTQLMQLNIPGSTSNIPEVDIEGTIALLGRSALKRAMAFDWTTGTPLQDLVPTDIATASSYGLSVAMNDHKMLVSSVGKAYEFQLVPEPEVAALIAIGLVAICLVVPRHR